MGLYPCSRSAPGGLELTGMLHRAFLIEEQKIVKRVLHDQQKKVAKK